MMQIWCLPYTAKCFQGLFSYPFAMTRSRTLEGKFAGAFFARGLKFGIFLHNTVISPERTAGKRRRRVPTPSELKRDPQPLHVTGCQPQSNSNVPNEDLVKV